MLQQLDNMLISAAVNYGMTEEMTTALETAFTNVASDGKSVIVKALPVGLGFAGTVLAITLGVKFFKGLVKK